MTKELCSGCKYHVQLDKKFLCRRFPPAPYGKYGFAQPYTHADNWCGEFKPKTATKKKEVTNGATSTATTKRRGRPKKTS